VFSRKDFLWELKSFVPIVERNWLKNPWEEGDTVIVQSVTGLKSITLG